MLDGLFNFDSLHLFVESFSSLDDFQQIYYNAKLTSAALSLLEQVVLLIIQMMRNPKGGQYDERSRFF